MLNITIGAIFALIVGFGFLIFVHELGHFLVAKWVGIKCTQFAIGFGPSIVAWRKGIGLRAGSTEREFAERIEQHLRRAGTESEEGAGESEAPADNAPGRPRQVIDAAAAELGLGETEYRLNYLPLGGYVKMLGQEDLDPSARSDDPRAFNSKPIWARACVISAGVVMNLLFGLIFFVIAFMAGVRFPPPLVGGVLPESPAATTYAQGHEGDPAYRGLQVGDRITHIDDDLVRDMMDVRAATMLTKRDNSLRYTVHRSFTDETLQFVLTPRPDERQENLLTVGIAPPQTRMVADVREGSAAAAAGLTAGMQVESVDGQPVADHGSFYRLITARRGQPANVRFADADGNAIEMALSAQPQLTETKVGGHRIGHLIGLVPATQVAGFLGQDSPLKKAGGQVGDVIAELNGHPWPTPLQVINLVKEGAGGPIDVKLLRGGEILSLGEVMPKGDKLQFYPRDYLEGLIVGDTLPASPASILNLTAGSRIVKIQDRPVESWADLQRELGALAIEVNGQPIDVAISYELNIAGTPPETTTVRLSPDQARLLAKAGWMSPTAIAFEDMLEPVVVANPLVAIGLGFEKTWQIVVQTYISLARVADGSVEFKQIRGPVGIVHVGTKVARQGFTYFLFFLGLISISLAVINFLPIPIVDGGLMVFLLIEKIKGSPASPAMQIAAMWIGLALIGGVFLLVTYNDLARLFGVET